MSNGRLPTAEENVEHDAAIARIRGHVRRASIAARAELGTARAGSTAERCREEAANRGAGRARERWRQNRCRSARVARVFFARFSFRPVWRSARMDLKVDGLEIDSGWRIPHLHFGGDERVRQGG